MLCVGMASVRFMAERAAMILDRAWAGRRCESEGHLRIEQWRGAGHQQQSPPSATLTPRRWFRAGLRIGAPLIE